MFELVIIAVVVLLVFGASKVRSAGSDLGAALKGFRRAVQAPQPPPATHEPGQLPDAEFPEAQTGRARGSGKPGA
ncbi:MAG TPA: twin-arginine translocase TatA/TatE family subunit [Steroidobacteraceae bacterium]|jgi:TatA/E family protein of Tat protein translocase|nr:twin-arginine translocase TatA/TatE family subunit [Steroidobacteraceae bacterium]